MDERGTESEKRLPFEIMADSPSASCLSSPDRRRVSVQCLTRLLRELFHQLGALFLKE